MRIKLSILDSIFSAPVTCCCCLVMPNSLWTHGLQLTRLPCPKLPPGVCSKSRPLCQWCHPTSLPSVIPFSSCLQSFPASGSFLMNWLLASGGPSIRASVSESVLPMNIQGWFPLELTGFISLKYKEFSRDFSSTAFQKHQFFGTQPSLLSNFHIDLTLWNFVGKMISLLFNTLGLS